MESTVKKVVEFKKGLPKIQKKQLLPMQVTFTKLSKQKFPIKFSYFIAKNLKMVAKECEIYKELVQPSYLLLEYDKKRIAILEKHAKLDENENPIIKNDNYILKEETKEECNKQIDELAKKYQTEIDKQNEKQAELEKMLEEDSDLPLHRIKFEYLPEELSPHDLAVFIDLVEDE